MATKTIPQLPSAAPLSGSELFESVQASGGPVVSVRVTANQLKNFMNIPNVSESGTPSETWQIDNDNNGVILKNFLGTLQVRNATDTDFVKIQASFLDVDYVVLGAETEVTVNVGDTVNLPGGASHYRIRGLGNNDDTIVDINGVSTGGHVWLRAGGSETLTIQNNTQIRTIDGKDIVLSEGGYVHFIQSGSPTRLTQVGYTDLKSHLLSASPLSGSELFEVETAAGNIRKVSLNSINNYIGFTGTSVSASASAVDGQVVLVDASSGVITTELTYTENAYIVVKKIDASANAVTIQADDGKTIDGVASKSLTVQYQSFTFFGSGGTWNII